MIVYLSNLENIKQIYAENAAMRHHRAFGEKKRIMQKQLEELFIQVQRGEITQHNTGVPESVICPGQTVRGVGSLLKGTLAVLSLTSVQLPVHCPSFWSATQTRGFLAPAQLLQITDPYARVHMYHVMKPQEALN